MPFQKNGKRDYEREAQWEKTRAKHRIRDRLMRVHARRELMREGKVKPNDGMHVDHIRPIISGGGNTRSNLRVVTARTNLEKEARRKSR